MIILQTQSSTEACRIQNTNRSLLKWLEILEQELQNTKKPYTTLFSLNGQKKKWTYEAELGKKKKKEHCLCVLVAKSCPTLCDPMDYSPPGECPQDNPGKNTGVGCHSLLQEIFPTQGSNLGLLHCRQILYRLSHLGSPNNAWAQTNS